MIIKSAFDSLWSNILGFGVWGRAGMKIVVVGRFLPTMSHQNPLGQGKTVQGQEAAKEDRED